MGWRVAMGLLVLVVSAPLAAAEAVPSESLVVSGGWIRAMPPVAKNSAGYLVIDNRGDADDVLLGARLSTIARVTELHEMAGDGEARAMVRLDTITIPAHSKVALQPGGKHLMLIDLKKPLKPGKRVPAMLNFRNAGEVAVTLVVREAP